MATSSLEFTLSLNSGGIAQGMARAREEITSNLRGLSQAARSEGQRIQAALNAITLSENAARRIQETRTALGAASTEATRLGNAFRQSQAELSRMTGQIERATAELTRLRQTPASSRTAAQNAEIQAVQRSIQNLRTQADALRGFTTTLGRDYDRASSAVSRLNATLAAETGELNRLRSGLQSAGADTNRLADAQTALQARMARLTAQAREQQRLQGAREVLNLAPTANSEREINRVRAAYERLRSSGTMTATELARAHVAMTERIIALRNSTDGLASRFALVREELAKLAVAGAGIGLAAREAIRFESAMSDVRKVVDFPTPQAFNEMTADIKAMSREIPLSLTGLAKIAESGGQMGIAAKELQGFTEVVAQMSTAFKISADEAGTSVGKMMNIFALTVPQTRLLADAINHLGNNTNAVERDIVEVMNRTGGMARVFGLANTETAALSATFLSMGLGPERASTAVNALLRELMNAPQQTDKFKTALLRVGLSAEQMAEKIQKGPQQAIMDLLQRLASLDKQTKMETLVGLFGDLYSDEIVQVVNNLDKYKEILGLVGNESSYAGSMQREFAERIKTTEAQLQLAKNAISEAAVNLGSAFLPAIVVAAKAVAALAHGLADLVQRFPSLSAAVATAVTAFAGFNAFRLIWSVMRAGIIALLPQLGALLVAARALVLTPVGAILTAASVAAYAFSKATESSVPPLLETASAMKKSRAETEEKIKTLEGLKNILESTRPGTKEYIDAEEKLAQLLPNANLSLDEQGRLLAKVGVASSENLAKMREYLKELKADNSQTFALQLDAQARAFVGAKKEMVDYTDGLRSWYGIGTDKAQTSTQRFWMWMAKLTGSFDENVAKGAEMRRQLSDTEGGMNALLQEAKKAGLSVQELGKAMDAVHVDPATKAMVVDLYRSMTREADAAAGKTKSVAEAFQQFATAMTGPAAAARKVVTEAIGVVDQQLGKYNEALGKHRSELKQAVDDEVKSWKAMGDAATAHSKTITDKIDEQFAARQRALEQMASAGAVTERSYIAENTRLISQENAARMEESRRQMYAILQLVDEEYKTRYATAKQLNQDLFRVDEERIKAQKSALDQRASDYKAVIDRLIAEEHRHLEASKQIEEQRRNFKLSIEDKLAGLQEKLMTPAQAYADKQRRIDEEEQKARDALRNGDFEKAKQHAERMISLAEQTSEAVKAGNQEVVSQATAVTTASKEIQTAASIVDEALRQQGAAHQNAATALHNQYTTLAGKLNEVRSVVAELDKDLAKDHRLMLAADASKVQEEVSRIDALVENRERVLKVKAELQQDANFLEDMPNRISQRLVGPVTDGLNAVTGHFERFKAVFSGFDPEIKAKLNIDAASGTIDGLATRFQEFKTQVEAGATVRAQAETSQAIEAMDAVTARANALDGRVVTYTVRQVTEEAHRFGGVVGLARGGHLPGFGGGDRIRALLEAGEFVVRKEAVQRYGLGLLESLNRMRLRLPEMPRYANGGLVNNLVIPALPPMTAFAGGGSVAPPVEGVVRLDLFSGGRPVASIPGPRQQIRQIVDALKDLERGVR